MKACRWSRSAYGCAVTHWGRQRWYSAVSGIGNRMDTLRLYEMCVKNGEISFDPAQEMVAKELSRIQMQMEEYSPKLDEYRKQKTLAEAELAKLQERQEKKTDDQPVQAEVQMPEMPRIPRGLYIHGKVGTGKTVLMDMFFQTTDIPRKRRVHFHEFMLEVHERIHAWKQDRLKKHGRDLHLNLSPEADGIAKVAESIAHESTLLAFDEFVVTDVADAMILRHLFSEIFNSGSVMVATSNTKPSDLYLNGLNRNYFLPFLQTLERHCKEFDMNTSLDYRLSKMDGHSTSKYICSDSLAEMKAEFDRIFSELAQGAPAKAETIKVAFGRTMEVPVAANGVCKFDFEALCRGVPALGAADFQALCNNFHTVMIENVPRLGGANHNEARRFVVLIDQLYDRQKNLYLSSHVPLEELCAKDTKAEANEEDFELFSVKELNMAFKRLTSRLSEMQSPEWPY